MDQVLPQPTTGLPAPAFLQLVSKKLFNDDIVALASPEFIQANRLRSMEQLKGLALIVTERRFFSWKSILTDFSWFNQCRFILVKYTHQALSAAAHGHGVALANKLNSAEYVTPGELQVPFDIPFDDARTPSYYFSCLNKNINSPKVQLFHNWLHRIVQSE